MDSDTQGRRSSPGKNEATSSSSDPQATNKPSRGWQYWTIIAALCVVSSLPALEGTVVSTALPSIVRDLGGGQTYVWVINAYFLSRFAATDHHMVT